MSSGLLGMRCANQRPTGDSSNPKIAIKPAALYLKILFLSPNSAPTPAASAIADRAIGAASATDKCRAKTSKGTDTIPPPAPVSPMRRPTRMPSAGLINIE